MKLKQETIQVLGRDELKRIVDDFELAKHLFVAKDSIYRWTKQRGLPSHTTGSLRKAKLSEVDDWMRVGGPMDDEGVAERPARADAQDKPLGEANSAGVVGVNAR